MRNRQRGERERERPSVCWVIFQMLAQPGVGKDEVRKQSSICVSPVGDKFHVGESSSAFLLCQQDAGQKVCRRQTHVERNLLFFFFFLQESQIKAMKETVQLCLTSVFRDQPPPLSLIGSNPTQMLLPPRTTSSKIPDVRTKSKVCFIVSFKVTWIDGLCLV